MESQNQMVKELKEVNENLRLLNKAVIGLNKKMDLIETNTRDEIKKMSWYKRRSDSADVYVQVSIVSVGDINTVMQQFSCEFYLSLRWEEPGLKDMIGKEDEVDWNNQWEPGIYFVDLVQVEKFERNEAISKPNEEGGNPWVTFYYHIRGAFKEVLDVAHFPFDYQPLTLTITTSWTWDYVALKKDYEKDDNIRTWNFTGRNEWKLEPHVLNQSTFTCKEPAASDNIFPIYKIKMHALRKYGYFIYNVALIMDCLSALTLTAYTVEASSPGERMQISLTLLLTSIALKFVVNGFVPQVPYPTMLDKFMLSCMGFQFLVAVENAVAPVIHLKYPKYLNMFEEVSLYGLMVIFIIMNIIFGAFWYKYTSSSKRMRRKHEMEYSEQKAKTKILRNHFQKSNNKNPAPHHNYDIIEADETGLIPRKGSKSYFKPKGKWMLRAKRKRDKIVKSSAVQHRI